MACRCVDSSDPAERFPITVLRKASSKPHATTGCVPRRGGCRERRSHTLSAGSASALTSFLRRAEGPASSSRPPRLPHRPARAATACAFAAVLALLLAAETAQAQTEVKLVSNTGQRQVSGYFTFAQDFAIAFRTGGNAEGYELTRLDIRMKSTVSPVFSVTIRQDSYGAPRTSLGRLTNPASLSSTFSLHRFSASPGIKLAADTVYWAVFDQDDGDGDTRLAYTESDAEDADTLAGWTISNSRVMRPLDSIRWQSGPARVPQIAVYGSVTGATGARGSAPPGRTPSGSG